MNPHILRYNVTLHGDSIPFILKQKLLDQYIQHWFQQINSSSRGEFYSIFKTEFKLEPYLIRLHPSDRIYMCKLRCSNLNFLSKLVDGQIF
jgi:hypothetical protein